MASCSSPSATAGGRGMSWALLDRAPRVTDLGDADVLLDLVPPPGVSIVYLDAALLPARDTAPCRVEGAPALPARDTAPCRVESANASDPALLAARDTAPFRVEGADASAPALLPARQDAARDTAPCRVEGADASGHLLLAFPSARAPGESNLVVCRPVRSSGGATKAKGKADILPAFPEEALGLAISPAAPTGIIADLGSNSGDGYFVAQLQMSASSSTPVVAVALCFSSEEREWTVREVAGDDRLRGFCARSVVSHDRGVRGDGHLVFVDVKQGVLLFHPQQVTVSGLVQFPDPKEGGGEGEDDEGDAAVDATVESSEGKIVYMTFYKVSGVSEGTMIGMWWLSEKHLRWHCNFNLYFDEVFGCNERVQPLRGVPSIGPVDPENMSRIVFAMRHPNAGTLSSFCVEVMPTELVLRRVKLLGDVESCVCLDSGLVCPLFRDMSQSRSWMEIIRSAMHRGKQVGTIALRAVDKSRKYADKLPGAVQLVGGALGLPHASTLLAAANAIKTVNDSINIAEHATSWLWRNRPGAPGLIYKVVGTKQEARDAAKEWRLNNEPANMMLDPAEDLTQEQWNEICVLLDEEGAGTLVQHYDYVLVGRPPR
ncbi:hypothetical protein ACP4OV_019443 [Aristida adscensionis]